MEKRKTKKEIVKMLLKNNELEEQDEEELLNLLIDQPISIDVDMGLYSRFLIIPNLLGNPKFCCLERRTSNR